MVSVISQGKRTYQNKLCSKCYNKYEQWSYCLSLIVFIMQLSSPQLKYTLQTFIIVSCFLQFCDFHFNNKFKKRSYSFFFGGDFLWNKFKKQYFVLLKNFCVLSKSVPIQIIDQRIWSTLITFDLSNRAYLGFLWLFPIGTTSKFNGFRSSLQSNTSYPINRSNDKRGNQ